MIVYLITNTLNGKRYVGATTKKLKYRIFEHIDNSKRNKIGNLAKDIATYGWGVFKAETLTTCTSIEHLDTEEKRFISELDTAAPKGYNLTSGGRLTYELSSITKELFSTQRKGKPPHPNTLKALDKARYGRVISEETHKKLSEAQKGNKKGLGHVKSPEVRKAIGIVQRGDKNHAAKLTWDIVNAIRADYASGLTVMELSDKYNVLHGRVSYIVRYISWVPEGMQPNTELVYPKKEDAVKLTWELVNLIRQEYSSGVKIIDLHRKFNVPTTTLGRIVHYNTWIPTGLEACN